MKSDILLSPSDTFGKTNIILLSHCNLISTFTYKTLGGLEGPVGLEGGLEALLASRSARMPRPVDQALGHLVVVSYLPKDLVLLQSVLSHPPVGTCARRQDVLEDFSTFSFSTFGTAFYPAYTSAFQRPCRTTEEDHPDTSAAACEKGNGCKRKESVWLEGQIHSECKLQLQPHLPAQQNLPVQQNLPLQQSPRCSRVYSQTFQCSSTKYNTCV